MKSLVKEIGKGTAQKKHYLDSEGRNIMRKQVLVSRECLRGSVGYDFDLDLGSSRLEPI